MAWALFDVLNDCVVIVPGFVFQRAAFFFPGDQAQEEPFICPIIMGLIFFITAWQFSVVD